MLDNKIWRCRRNLCIDCCLNDVFSEIVPSPSQAGAFTLGVLGFSHDATNELSRKCSGSHARSLVVFPSGETWMTLMAGKSTASMIFPGNEKPAWRKIGHFPSHVWWHQFGEYPRSISQINILTIPLQFPINHPFSMDFSWWTPYFDATNPPHLASSSPRAEAPWLVQWIGRLHHPISTGVYRYTQY